MRLRTRLFLMFSLLSLALVALATGLTYWLASSALISELEERSDHAAARVEAYLELRGERAEQAVAALSREAAIRRTMAGLASGGEEPGSPLVVGLAEKSVAGTDLDVFEILDSDGTVLSSAHWKAFYGNRHVEAVPLARTTGGSATTAVIEVKGRSRVTLVSALTVRIGQTEFLMIGGYYVDTQSTQELKNLLDVEVMLVPLRSSTGAAGDEEPDPGPPTEVTAAGAGGSISKSTHVLREVYLPHAGGEPVAKFVVGVSRARLQGLAADLRRAFLYAAAAALVFSWIVALILARGTTRRLERLTAGARRVAAGDLETAVPGEGPDELGQLVASFNKMVVDLKESRSRSARMERIAAWREVARRIAHEIKNALSPIQLSIENIQRGYGKGEKEFENVLSKATDTVRAEVDGLREMVDEFSQLARMPAPRLARHDLRKMAERVVGLYEGTREGVSVELAAQNPVEAEIDPGLLSRALGNIVANAVEVCSDGGLVTVTVEPEEGAQHVRISVRDNGPGLSPDQLESVFEPYYTTKESGTGLGLAIAMKIVTDHGGNLEVESQTGVGSVFSIVLPAPGAKAEQNG